MRRRRISRICRYLGNGSRKVCGATVRLLRPRAIQGSRNRLTRSVDISCLLSHTLVALQVNRLWSRCNEHFSGANAEELCRQMRGMSEPLTHPTWMEMDYAAFDKNVAALRRRLAPATRLIAR